VVAVVAGALAFVAAGSSGPAPRLAARPPAPAQASTPSTTGPGPAQVPAIAPGPAPGGGPAAAVPEASGSCLPVSVGAGPPACVGSTSGRSAPLAVEVGQVVTVAVPPGSSDLRATGGVLAPVGPDRFVSVGRGTGALRATLPGGRTWSLAVVVH
jgi:hypothetical protein